jgi:hypothetical protein
MTPDRIRGGAEFLDPLKSRVASLMEWLPPPNRCSASSPSTTCEARETDIDGPALATLVAAEVARHRRTVVLHSAAALLEPLPDDPARTDRGARELAASNLRPTHADAARTLLSKASNLLESVRVGNPSPRPKHDHGSGSTPSSPWAQSQAG